MRAVTHHSSRPGNQGGGQSALAGEIDSLKRLMRENNKGQVVVVDKGQSSGYLFSFSGEFYFDLCLDGVFGPMDWD